MATKPLEFDPKHRFWAMAPNGDLYKIDPETVSVTRPNGMYMPISISNPYYGQRSIEKRADMLFMGLLDRSDANVFIDTKNLLNMISALTILQSIIDEGNE